MTEIQETMDLVQKAGSSIIDVGVVGALLILSLAGNVALIWALVRCYRASLNHQHGGGL